MNAQSFFLPLKLSCSNSFLMSFEVINIKSSGVSTSSVKQRFFKLKKRFQGTKTFLRICYVKPKDMELCFDINLVYRSFAHFRRKMHESQLNTTLSIYCRIASEFSCYHNSFGYRPFNRILSHIAKHSKMVFVALIIIIYKTRSVV